jgi:hypothetical protein
MLNSTPNHPILTERGWVASGKLNIGDNIINISDHSLFTSNGNPENNKTTFDELFSFFELALRSKNIKTLSSDFYGDIAINQEVNIIDIKSELTANIKTTLDESLFQLFFAKANKKLHNIPWSSYSPILQSLFGCWSSSNSAICVFSKLLFLLKRQELHTIYKCLLSIPEVSVILCQYSNNNIPSTFKLICKLQAGFTSNIQIYYFLIWELIRIWYCIRSKIPNNISNFSQLSTDPLLTQTMETANFYDRQPRLIKFDNIINAKTVDFSGHVYNMQNTNGWYIAENLIVKNCHCVAIWVQE